MRSRPQAVRSILIAACILVVLRVSAWPTGARAASLATPNVALTLADVPLEGDEEAGSLALRLFLDAKAVGPMIWAEAGRRRDHRGAVLSSASDGAKVRLKVRVLIEPRHSSKPYAFDDPGEVGRFTIEATRTDDGFRGTWTGSVGSRTGKGVVEGSVAAPASRPRNDSQPGLDEHPRLLIRRGQIEPLRRKAQTDWGKAMMKRLAAEHPSRSNMAVGRGLLYVLTGDRAHAAEAQRLLEADIDDREWLPIGPVHDPAHTATEACIAYDLIHDACDQAFHDRMQGLLARSVRDLYWFSNVVRPNGNDASNWSAMYRAGCGMAALSMSTDRAAWSPEPVAPQLPRLGPPKGLAVGDGVPVVKLRPGKEWYDWLWAGPFKLAPGQNALEGIGGAGAARPAAGTKVSGKGVNGPFAGEFQPAPKWLVTQETHRAAPWSYGSFMLGGLHGKPHDWQSHRALWQAGATGPSPVNLGWKDGRLTVQAGGFRFEGVMDLAEGTYSFSNTTEEPQ